MGIHGGDIYRNQAAVDFSVNVNPLGTPRRVRAALHRAAAQCGRYPDMEAAALREAVGGMLAVPGEYLVFGNGASELFMAVAHGIRPKKTVIPAPSFYGYEYAAKAAGSEIRYCELRRENGFDVTGELCAALTEDVDLLFLANPNNPTGRLLDGDTVMDLLRYCREKGIYVVLDECFIEFCGGCRSFLSAVEEFENLILVRTFTKIFSIPGVRLGYLVCKNKALCEKTAAQLPEWNLSCFAQEAGRACAKEAAFVKKTQAYIRKERRFLEEGLRKNGFAVLPSMTNFILFYVKEAPGEKTLYERLLQQGILIRDCGNFRGLGGGCYRIAVKRRRENKRLLWAVAHWREEQGDRRESDRVCAAGGDRKTQL